MENSLESAVKQFFAAAAESGLEIRAGQIEMADEICKVMTLKRPLAVEAEVGIGKSFAYLVPALMQYKKEHRQIVIATSTIALQEQLCRDAHAVMRRLGIEAEIILAKGMKNYACMKKVRSLYRKHTKDQKIMQLWHLVLSDKQDKAQLGLRFDEAEWEQICVSNFGGRYCQQCDYSSKCAYSQLRARLISQNAVIICNQNMLVAHLMRQQAGKNIFQPGFPVLIVDEAHNLESHFREAFTEYYDKTQIIHMVRECGYKSKNKNILSMTQKTINDIQALFEIFKDQVQEQENNPDSDTDIFYLEQNPMIHRILARIKSNLTKIEEEHELTEIYYFLREVYHHSEKSKSIVWLEHEQEIRLCVCKKDIRKEISKMLYQMGRCTILTSATISNQQDGTPYEKCGYYLNSIGFPEIGKVSEPKKSPFDYDHHAMLYCSVALPYPRPELREEYQRASVPEIVRLLKITDGKTLILFTAKSDMEYVYKKLSNMNLPYKILMQSRTSSQEYRLDKFRNDTNSVILGTGTYWEGINIEGESLSQVIIYKLPFPAPNPIIDYKMSLAERPVMEVAVPEMLTKLRQGAGRLIRSATDKGIVSVLDPRISSQSRTRYKQAVFDSLPIKNKTENIEEIQHFWDKISSGGESI